MIENNLSMASETQENETIHAREQRSKPSIKFSLRHFIDIRARQFYSLGEYGIRLENINQFWRYPMLTDLFAEFIANYDVSKKDAIWASQSETFRNFWDQNIVNGSPESLTDDDIDAIVRILDRNGKGNTKDTEAVAKAMIAQGAWRRMFRELCTNKKLSSIISSIFTSSSDPDIRAKQIDLLYKENEGRKNHLTGQSGNAINAMLAAYDPFLNLSVISLNDRKMLIDHFGFPITFDFLNSSMGTRIVKTNGIILEGFKNLGVSASARTICRFCYSPEIESLWKKQLRVKRGNKEVVVSIPTNDEKEAAEDIEDDGPRESIVMQALIANIGATMGLTIWLPKADRARVLQKWNPQGGALLESLPLHYGDTAMKTIENIDVLWLKGRTIVRAFEVEHTTSIYSGLLRMADLVALLSNIEINLHIVAPATRREKVFEEIRRPVFSLLEGGALSEKCTFISYDNLIELSSDKNLGFLKNDVLDKYAEPAE